MEGRIFRKRYRLKSRLGSGSFGTAWLVADERRKDEEHVMKQIFVGMLEPDDTVDALKEARLLGQLKHPNIVALKEAFIEEQFVCIVTEYCEGGDLDMRIKATAAAEQVLPQRQVMLWLVQLAMALRYLHERRILHRDLKTKNVFLRHGVVKLGDFGIARVLMGTHDEANTFAGTPYFMSPEALQSSGYNSKSDMWSLGCVLFEMCSLRRAFDSEGLMGLMYQICEGEAPEIPADHYDHNLRSLAASLLQRDPNKRPSAAQILQLPFVTRLLEGLRLSLSQRTDRSLQTDKARIQGAMARDRPATPPKHEGPARTAHAPDTAQALTPKERAALRKQRAADKRAEELRDAIHADTPPRAVRPGSGGRRGQGPQYQRQASGVDELIYGSSPSRNNSASSLRGSDAGGGEGLARQRSRSLRGSSGGAETRHRRTSSDPFRPEGQPSGGGASYVPSAMDPASPGVARSGIAARPTSSQGSRTGLTVPSPLSREGTAENLLLPPRSHGAFPDAGSPRIGSPRSRSGSSQSMADELFGDGAAPPRRGGSGRRRHSRSPGPARSPREASLSPSPRSSGTPVTPHWVLEHPDIFKDWAAESADKPAEKPRRGSRHSRDEVILPVSDLEEPNPLSRSPRSSVGLKRPSTSESVASLGDSRSHHAAAHHEHKRKPGSASLGDTMGDLTGTFGSSVFSVSDSSCGPSLANPSNSDVAVEVSMDAAAAESMYLAEKFEEEFSSGDEQDMLDLQQCMSEVLSSPVESTAAPGPETNDPDPLRAERMANLRKEGQRLLGGKFLSVYQYLLKARKAKVKEQVVKSRLMSMTDNYRDCFVVDQLVYMECFG